MTVEFSATDMSTAHNDGHRAANPFPKIRKWAQDRNLLNYDEGAHPRAQMLKGMEEFGEIAAAIARNDRDAIADGIGDMVVVLTILAALEGLSIEDCIEHAWDEIKDRKGKLVRGVFIKEADLK